MEEFRAAKTCNSGTGSWEQSLPSLPENCHHVRQKNVHVCSSLFLPILSQVFYWARKKGSPARFWTQTFTLICQCSPSKPACPGLKMSVNCTSFSERTTCQMSIGTINKPWSYSLFRYPPTIKQRSLQKNSPAAVVKNEFLAASDMLLEVTMRVLSYRKSVPVQSHLHKAPIIIELDDGKNLQENPIFDGKNHGFL